MYSVQYIISRPANQPTSLRNGHARQARLVDADPVLLEKSTFILWIEEGGSAVSGRQDSVKHDEQQKKNGRHGHRNNTGFSVLITTRQRS